MARQGDDILVAKMQAKNPESLRGALAAVSTAGLAETEWTIDSWRGVLARRERTALAEADDGSLLVFAQWFYTVYSGNDCSPAEYTSIVTALWASLGEKEENTPNIMEGVNQPVQFPRNLLNPVKDYLVTGQSSMKGEEKIGATDNRVNLNQNSNALLKRWQNIMHLRQEVKAAVEGRYPLPNDLKKEVEDEVAAASFLALNMMRFGKKDRYSTLVHMQNRVKVNLGSLISWENGDLPLPSKKFYDFFEARFKAGGKAYLDLLSVPVVALVTLKQRSADVALQGFLNAGCLLALGENGLGAINWLLKVWKTLGATTDIQQQTCANLFMNRLTGHSVASVWEFLNSNPAPGWTYCRIFDSTCHAGFSVKNHAPFVMVCIHICFADGAQERIQEMPQLSESRALMHTASVMAQAISDVLLKHSGAQVIGLDAGAAEVSNIFQSMMSQSRPPSNWKAAPTTRPRVNVPFPSDSESDSD